MTAAAIGIDAGKEGDRNLWRYRANDARDVFPDRIGEGIAGKAMAWTISQIASRAATVTAIIQAVCTAEGGRQTSEAIAAMMKNPVATK